jgi:small subunit ribosomal protein S3
MGQKSHPYGLRIGVIESWRSRWFAKKNIASLIGEDIKIRQFIHVKLSAAGIARVEIERAATRVKVNIFCAKPGLVIGKKGKDIEDLRKDLKKLVKREVSLNIVETRKPDLDAQLVADNVASQLEKRANFRRAMRDAITKSRRAGAEGVKVRVSGRLNGAEIARVESMREGRVPLHTLRAEIDYATSEAHTTAGKVGIKVWVFKGEKFKPGHEETFDAMQL